METCYLVFVSLICFGLVIPADCGLFVLMLVLVCWVVWCFHVCLVLLMLVVTACLMCFWFDCFFYYLVVFYVEVFAFDYLDFYDSCLFNGVVYLLVGLFSVYVDFCEVDWAAVGYFGCEFGCFDCSLLAVLSLIWICICLALTCLFGLLYCLIDFVVFWLMRVWSLDVLVTSWVWGFVGLFVGGFVCCLLLLCLFIGFVYWWFWFGLP